MLKVSALEANLKCNFIESISTASFVLLDRMLPMTSANTPIRQLHARLKSGNSNPRSVMEDSLYRANKNSSHNTYLTLDAARALDEA